MKISAVNTLSGAAVVALSLAASPVQAEKTAAPSPTLHGLADIVGGLEKRVNVLEDELKQVHHVIHASGYQQTSYQPSSTGSGGGGVRNYIIQGGDTISEVARLHGVERSALMAINQLKEGDPIYIGDELIIPGRGGKTAPAPASDRNHHTLAATTGGGQKPAPKVEPAPTVDPTPVSAPVSKPAPAASPNKPQFIDYKVRSGDSLSKISRANNISVADLVRANKLSNADALSINQMLRIPTSAGASASASSNAAPTPKPSFAGPAPAPAPSSPSTPEADNDDFGLYTVQKGDTLWSLSRDFFTTQQEIQQLNSMGRSTILKPGQELVVPTKKYFEYHNRLSHAG